ncbi:MAG TPA: hypothetical protein VEU08_03030, partial [Vicinamibacterales bacterium]|nr:hypothetical protein [Vicinamibacterales bacterium]
MMKRIAIALTVAALGAGVAVRAQEKRSDTLLTTEHYLDWERVSDAQISPDGARIVYTRQHVNKMDDRWESELWIINIDGSQHRFLTKGSAARWSPDGKRLLYQAEGEPRGSQLFVRWIDADGPATQVTRVSETPRSAKWSPDGRMVAFTGFAPTGHTHTVSDLWVMPLASNGSGDMRKISGDFDRDPINLKWAADGSGVYFDADDRGARNVAFAALVGGVKALTSGRQMLSFDSISKNGIAAGISADLKHPQDVVKVDLKQPGQIVKLTDVNADVLQGIQLGATEEITYTSSGSAKVMAWVTKPPSFDASKKYPLILEIHGGPFGNYNVA